MIMSRLFVLHKQTIKKQVLKEIMQWQMARWHAFLFCATDVIKKDLKIVQFGVRHIFVLQCETRVFMCNLQSWVATSE